MTRTMNQSDDVALSDDFTKGFINTEIETGEGFHYFESGNGKFSMWFPEGYKLEDVPSYVSKDSYESINLYKKAEDGVQKLIKMTYYIGNDPGQVEGNFSVLLNDYGFEDNYEEKDTDQTHIYSGNSFVELIENRAEPKAPTAEKPANQYFALIKDQHSDQHVKFSYEIHCEVNCSINSPEESSFFDTIIRNINFKE
ncbi:hypothetical protein [Shouchella patagoniensis]|uniref:hypothetical protein n=1 Tax=Shouchella patagoniensis TaxID=228576 RepID=UPI000994F14B|nr:hypothetical protein [Shouchella patagoniensis]